MGRVFQSRGSPNVNRSDLVIGKTCAASAANEIRADTANVISRIFLILKNCFLKHFKDPTRNAVHNHQCQNSKKTKQNVNIYFRSISRPLDYTMESDVNDLSQNLQVQVS